MRSEKGTRPSLFREDVVETHPGGHPRGRSHGTTGYRAEGPVRCRQRYGDDDSQQAAYRSAADVGGSGGLHLRESPTSGMWGRRVEILS